MNIYNSYDELRNSKNNEADRCVLVTGINKNTTLGAGFFIYDKNDKTSTDDSGIVIKTIDNHRWKRMYDGAVCIEWFDLNFKGETDQTDKFFTIINRYGTIISLDNLPRKILITKELSTSQNIDWNLPLSILAKTPDMELNENGDKKAVVLKRMLHIKGKSIKIQGVTFDGKNNASQAIHIEKPDFCQIIKCNFINFWGQESSKVLYIHTAKKIRIIDSEFNNIACKWSNAPSDEVGSLRAIWIKEKCDDVVISGCYFKDIVNRNSPLGEIKYDDADAIVCETDYKYIENIQRVIISNCIFDNVGKSCVKSFGNQNNSILIKDSICLTTGVVSNEPIASPENTNAMLCFARIYAGSLIVKNCTVENGVMSRFIDVADTQITPKTPGESTITIPVRNIIISECVFNPLYSKYSGKSLTTPFVISSPTSRVVINDNVFGKYASQGVISSNFISYRSNKHSQLVSSFIDIRSTGSASIHNCYFEGDSTPGTRAVTISSAPFLSMANNMYLKTTQGVLLSHKIMEPFQATIVGEIFMDLTEEEIRETLSVDLRQFIVKGLISSNRKTD